MADQGGRVVPERADQAGSVTRERPAVVAAGRFVAAAIPAQVDRDDGTATRLDDAETVDDDSFRLYGQACAAVLARAHGQSPTAGEVVGYIGTGDVTMDAIVSWSYAYADLSRSDYEAFVAAG